MDGTGTSDRSKMTNVGMHPERHNYQFIEAPDPKKSIWGFDSSGISWDVKELLTIDFMGYT